MECEPDGTSTLPERHARSFWMLVLEKVASVFSEIPGSSDSS